MLLKTNGILNTPEKFPLTNWFFSVSDRFYFFLLTIDSDQSHYCLFGFFFVPPNQCKAGEIYLSTRVFTTFLFIYFFVSAKTFLCYFFIRRRRAVPGRVLIREKYITVPTIS